MVVVVAQEYLRESVGAMRTSAARHLGKTRPAGLVAERLTEVCRLRLIGLLAYWPIPGVVEVVVPGLQLRTPHVHLHGGQ